MDKNKDKELVAEELAASLSRQLSEKEMEVPDLDLPEEKPEEAFQIDLSVSLDEEEEKADDPDDLLRELQAAVEEEFAGESPKETEEVKLPEFNNLLDDEVVELEETKEETEEVLPEAEAKEETEEVLPEAEAKEETEEVLPEAEAKEETEEVLPEAEENESTEEVLQDAEAVEDSGEDDDLFEKEEVEDTAEKTVPTSVETAETTIFPEAVVITAAVVAEEAFDEPDAGIQDVSQGVPAVTDAPTEELPTIPAGMSKRAQKKAEKKRLKQEAAEAREREKQEAAEAREREKQEAKEQKRLEKEERKANKKKGKGRVIFGLLFLFIAACAVVYLALSNRYKTVFFDGTKINDADCTGLTVEEAETVITRQMDEYDLKLAFRGGKEELVSGEAVGFEYVPDGSVQEIKDSQIPIMWATAFFEEYSYEATAACTYDEAKLTGAITALEECQLMSMEAPQDAYLKFNEETHKFEIVPEQPGSKFDLSSLIAAIEDAILNGVRELDVEELDIYENPTVTADNADLVAKRDELNDVISPVITYTLPNGTDKVLDATTLVTWLEHDDNGNYSYNPELWGNNVANYVEDLAGEVNTSETTAEFTTHNGAKVTLDNYLQGWLIDEEAEGQKLTENLSARESVTREPIYSQRAFSEENNGIGNTYVEVDLTSQYLWAVENGKVVIETPVVSGMMVASRYTPEGIYPLYGKQRGRTLRGSQAADGSYEYESWVDYWMPFNGGIGLHDASWRADFGGNIYVGGGSHGCVNLPVSKAAAIFDWIEGGTPVICYYTGGINLAPEGTYGDN